MQGTLKIYKYTKGAYVSDRVVFSGLPGYQNPAVVVILGYVPVCVQYKPTNKY